MRGHSSVSRSAPSREGRDSKEPNCWLGVDYDDITTSQQESYGER